MKTVEYYLNQLPDGYKQLCLKYADADSLNCKAESISQALSRFCVWKGKIGDFFDDLYRFYTYGGELPPLPKQTKTLDQAFQEYNEAHPEVYKTFEQMALALINKGVKHYGSKAIIEAIRYHTSVSEGKEFKINNNITPLFARVFEDRNPQHKGFFEKRASKLTNHE
jgi:hypothetical protein